MHRRASLLSSYARQRLHYMNDCPANYLLTVDINDNSDNCIISGSKTLLMIVSVSISAY